MSQNICQGNQVIVVVFQVAVSKRVPQDVGCDCLQPRPGSILGYHRGITFYTWTSDQFSLHGGKPLASTVRDATNILDDMMANETELPILEHTTNTSGYPEIIFALFDLLGLTFAPRIKDLGDRQIYRTDNLDLDVLHDSNIRFNRIFSSHAPCSEFSASVWLFP